MLIHELNLVNTKVITGVDRKYKRVHLLDLNYNLTLTNQLSKDYCAAILRCLGIYNEEHQHEFICYHTDSTISRFNIETANFEMLSLQDRRIYSEFKKEMFYLYGGY